MEENTGKCQDLFVKWDIEERIKRCGGNILNCVDITDGICFLVVVQLIRGQGF